MSKLCDRLYVAQPVKIHHTVRRIVDARVRSLRDVPEVLDYARNALRRSLGQAAALGYIEGLRRSRNFTLCRPQMRRLPTSVWDSLARRIVDDYRVALVAQMRAGADDIRANLLDPDALEAVHTTLREMRYSVGLSDGVAGDDSYDCREYLLRCQSPTCVAVAAAGMLGRPYFCAADPLWSRIQPPRRIGCVCRWAPVQSHYIRRYDALHRIVLPEAYTALTIFDE